MDYTILGRTGLRVSVIGLGCGGPSRLGTLTGRTEEEAIALVRQALDLGVTLIDTAELYETESIVGRALEGGGREGVVLSTKKTVFDEQGIRSVEDVRRGLEESLKRLRTDRVDIYHAHGVRSEHYAYVRDALLPCLEALRREGKVRFVGITERFSDDPHHAMLSQAIEDDRWDVIMVGFNFLNPSARRYILPKAMQRNVGVLNMIAFRRGFSRPERLAQRLWERRLPSDGVDPNDPLGFLVREGGADSLAEAAYRFCRWEPGVHVVLSGTGDLQHLEANAASVAKPPLSEGHLRRHEALIRAAFPDLI